MAMARHALKKRRRQLGLSQEALAQELGVGTSTYKAWEAGRSTPYDNRRPDLARNLKVTLPELDVMLNGGNIDATNRHVVPPWLNHLASLEWGAAAMQVFEPVAVNGLLQTASYATAVEQIEPFEADEIAQKVRLRMERQQVLHRTPDPLRLSVILDESVLYRVAGGPDVMAEQLDYLAEIAEHPNVVLQVLRLDAGAATAGGENVAAFSAAFGSFTILTNPGGEEPFMAVVEDRSGPHYLDRPETIEAHMDLFENLAGAALPPDESTAMFRSVAKERYHR